MFNMHRLLLVTLVAISSSSITGLSAWGTTLNDVKARGHVECGVHNQMPGFSRMDHRGRWSGLGVDLCRAVAAAVLGDANKVRFVALATDERLTALRSGRIDLLSHNTTWTMSRDTTAGVHFAAVTYYDGQGFMTRKRSGISTVLSLSGASICINPGTTTELNLADYFAAHGMTYRLVAFDDVTEMFRAYDRGLCEAVTSDQSGLSAFRLSLRDPRAHIILPEIISKEPLGPAVREGDDQWYKLVRWVHYAMVNAEELGATSLNVDSMLNSTHPQIMRLLGATGDFGSGVGLDRHWAYRVIKQVGNYGEVFERNIGSHSRLHIERGLNDLWLRGGILYAPPIR